MDRKDACPFPPSIGEPFSGSMSALFQGEFVFSRRPGFWNLDKIFFVFQKVPAAADTNL